MADDMRRSTNANIIYTPLKYLTTDAKYSGNVFNRKTDSILAYGVISTLAVPGGHKLLINNGKLTVPVRRLDYEGARRQSL